MSNTLSVIITGATGMVGEGVMHICLQDPAVEKVLVINRKPCGVTHPKLKEVLHSNFYDLAAVEDQLIGYNACFFCLGVSSVGMNKDAYYKATYILTMHVAQTLSSLNNDMVFSYISGASTDNTEKGSLNWARVKGKTENDLMKLPFKKVYAFRPAFIKPMKGMQHTHAFYKYINWLFPIGRAVKPSAFCTLQELGDAMIYATTSGYTTNIVEGYDIIKLAKEKNV